MGLRTVPGVVMSQRLIDWLLSEKDIKRRADGLVLGEQLFAKGFVRHSEYKGLLVRGCLFLEGGGAGYFWKGEGLVIFGRGRGWLFLEGRSGWLFLEGRSGWLFGMGERLVVWDGGKAGYFGKEEWLGGGAHYYRKIKGWSRGLVQRDQQFDFQN